MIYANKEEKDILMAIYTYRTLTVNMVAQYVLKRPIQEVRAILERMERSNWIEYNNDSDKENYFIKTGGINQIRHLLQEDPLQANKIKVKPRFLNHQLHLNEFVLQFFNQNEWVKTHEAVSYQDELRVNEKRYNNFRPDGLLQLGNTEVLLEMDMGTERSSAIRKKMERYFRFNEKAMLEGRKVLILFICHKTHTPYMLGQIHKAVASTLNVFHPDFDLIVGDYEKLLHYLKTEATATLTSSIEVYRQQTLETYQSHFPACLVKDVFNDKISQTYFDYQIAPARTNFKNYLVIDLKYLRFSRLKTWHYCSYWLSAYQKKIKNYETMGILVLYQKRDEELVKLLQPDVVSNEAKNKVITKSHEHFKKLLPTLSTK